MLFILHTNYLIHSVSGSSMEPALQDGDYVVVKRTQEVQRYAMISFSVSKEPGMFVKRIIGLPGDLILVQQRTLILDLAREGTFRSTLRVELSPLVAERLAEETKIPKNCYFVLGDHLTVSKDSRRFGYIKKTQIEGVLKNVLP